MASENWLTGRLTRHCVSEDASESDIKKGVPQALPCSPGSEPGDAAEKKFKEISEAYDALRQEAARVMFRFRCHGASGGFGEVALAVEATPATPARTHSAASATAAQASNIDDLLAAFSRR